jgi:hypothetical protein
LILSLCSGIGVRLENGRQYNMDQAFQSILDHLPPKQPPALEPYRELIVEMRHRGQTYRQIAQVLAEHFDVHSELAAIYDLLRPPARRKPRRPPERKPPQTVTPSVRRRVEALLEQPAPKPQSPVFDYDENEPLRLILNSKTNE